MDALTYTTYRDDRNRYCVRVKIGNRVGVVKFDQQRDSNRFIACLDVLIADGINEERSDGSETPR